VDEMWITRGLDNLPVDNSKVIHRKDKVMHRISTKRKRGC